MNLYKNIKFIPHRGYDSNKEDIVIVDIKKLDAAWRKSDKYFYISTGGKNSIRSKYEGFSRWLKNGRPIEVPIVSLLDNGSVGFLDGMHRFSYLRDIGIDNIPVIINKKYSSILKDKYSA